LRSRLLFRAIVNGDHDMTFLLPGEAPTCNNRACENGMD
jgi:hypothetical protein